MDKMIQVKELLEKRMRELEERLNVAKAKISQLMANKPHEMSSAVEAKKKRTGERGNKCKMGWALLMIFVVGLSPTCRPRRPCLQPAQPLP
jgi:hypothetical protein